MSNMRSRLPGLATSVCSNKPCRGRELVVWAVRAEVPPRAWFQHVPRIHDNLLPLRVESSTALHAVTSSRGRFSCLGPASPVSRRCPSLSSTESGAESSDCNRDLPFWSRSKVAVGGQARKGRVSRPGMDLAKNSSRKGQRRETRSLARLLFPSCRLLIMDFTPVPAGKLR